MARIFISYSRADRQFIDNLVPLIRKIYRNNILWFDDEIHGGTDWWQTILDQIEDCELFIYLISDEALESPYCQAELHEALRLKKQILPVIVRRLKKAYPGNIDDDLATVLRKTQYVDMARGFRDPSNNAKLYAAINQLLEVGRQQLETNVVSQPTPEPPVPDKKQLNSTVRAAYIAGVFAIVTAIIAGIFGLWQGVFANTNNATPTTQVAVNPTSEPNTPSPLEMAGMTQTQEAFNFQLTLEASNLTEAANEINTATAFAPTLAAQQAATVDAILTETRAAVLALTPSPTPIPPTNIPDPLTLALSRAENFEGSNDDWEPFSTIFPDDPTNTEMMLVPVGQFEMGSTAEEIDLAVQLCNEARQDGETCPSSFFEDEAPTNVQQFTTPFWIDRTEVTRANYQICVEAGICGETRDSQFSTEDLQPINRVTWFQADTYCEWRDGRLPTEAEWEYAVRGSDGWLYPWGNEFDDTLANHCDSNCAEADWSDSFNYLNPSNDDGHEITAPVGSYLNGASWVGALDMAGNVWEWTNSLYEDYPYDANDGRDDDTGDSTDVRRVLRGGSFFNSTLNLRSAYRLGGGPNFEYGNDFGFRCIRSYQE